MAEEFSGEDMERCLLKLAAEFDARGRCPETARLSLAAFRFYCLDAQDHIVHGGNLDVTDLEAAIRDAYRTCGDQPHVPSSRIEVWQGKCRLYVSGASASNSQRAS
jgi:hypothetical protein